MKLIADGVWLLRGTPPNIINAYLMGDVLIDSGTRLSGARVLRQLEGRHVAAHALTHAHPDHYGSSKRVCEELGVPLWCPAADVETVESGEIPTGDSPLGPLIRCIAPPPQKVDRPLLEGDEVGGFTVVAAPGHTPGHVAYWRESDRTLLLGDVFFGLHALTGVPGLHMPPDVLTLHPERNRESARRLGELEPDLVCFGHGPPLRDRRRFVEFAQSLG